LSISGDTLNNAYSLPTASSSTLGGVKTGSNITNSNGTISLSKTNVTSALGYTPPTTNTTYSTGTASTSGITKLYTGLGDNTDGTMTQKAIKAIVGTGGGIITDSLTANGYIKFANGVVIEWGTREASNNASWTYPLGLSTVYAVLINGNSQLTAGDYSMVKLSRLTTVTTTALWYRTDTTVGIDYFIVVGKA
jgi:hypothetical protein